ncbi:MAG: Macrolide export ATP-binding/permease protein MacB [Flavobacteriales bacterium]|nr:Macrolide export ATP-binding/permease protein MacB [Flavobacteriales bacterium]
MFYLLLWFKTEMPKEYTLKEQWKNKFLLVLRILNESIAFARQALIVNKLRTMLSLLGVTIGIFCIVAVFTVVDSLERNIKGSIESLGDNVVFVQKWPWTFGNDYPWWKYWQRPVASYDDLKAIDKNSDLAMASCFKIDAQKTVQYQSDIVENVALEGVSHHYSLVSNLNLQIGRFFTEQESAGGAAVALLGFNLAETLFLQNNPIGNTIKIDGHKFEVIGVLKKEGESIFGNSSDNKVIFPIQFARKLYKLDNENLNPTVMVKAKPLVTNEELMNELTMILRAHRKLKPGVEDNFALNQTSMIAQGFSSIFDIVNIAGFVIGGFSILVGGFSIANIMFVSVKERTGQIGIQKALGAKNYFILLQFLFESVFLCLIGGVAGILFIFLLTLLVSAVTEFSVSMSFYNVLMGISFSVIIGIVSGIFPSMQAAKLNPVDAMRSK